MPDLAKRQSTSLNWPPIDNSGPGTILTDFQTLLDFVGTAGIKTGGKNFRLPLAALGELDERMTHPLRPNLNRPQQLSYPHLNGLYLLLRASGLGVSSGQGDSGRLSVSAKRLAEWTALNPQEKYFTLAHTMLRANWSMIESGSSTNGPWHELSWGFDKWWKDRRPIKNAGVPASEFFYGWRSQTTAALLELFGILEIPRVAPQEGESWRITSVRATEFGMAFLTKFRDPSTLFDMDDMVRGRTDSKRRKWLGDLYRKHYPNCRNTLPEDEGEFVDGIWQFKVSLGNVWRRCVIPADLTVDDLIGGILTEIEFDFDHLYALQVRDRSGRSIVIGHPELDDTDSSTDEFAVGFLPLDPGQSMTLLYDFGDNWRFKITLEKILPADDSITQMKVIGKKGKAPAQYGDPDDDW